jgi:acylphosphatase
MNSSMQTQIRRYNIVVKGKVQDIGFRDYVIALANIAKIKHDTSMLPEVKRDTSVLPAVKSGIDSLNIKFDSYILEQREHSKHLVKILEKLAEKWHYYSGISEFRY